MADTERRCRRCGWEWLGSPRCPQPHPKRRPAPPSSGPRWTVAPRPIDPVKTRAYLAACAAKGYSGSVGPLAEDIRAMLTRLNAHTNEPADQPAWITEPA